MAEVLQQLHELRQEVHDMMRERQAPPPPPPAPAAPIPAREAVAPAAEV